MKKFDTYSVLPAYHGYQIVRHSDGHVVDRHYSLARAQDSAYFWNSLQYEDGVFADFLNSSWFGAAMGAIGAGVILCAIFSFCL